HSPSATASPNAPCCAGHLTGAMAVAPASAVEPLALTHTLDARGTTTTRGASIWRKASRLQRLNLLYVSKSFLWWQAVASIIGVKSSNALRSNSRCTWRHREGSRNVHNTAIRLALSPSHPCGSVTAGVHGCPRGVAPLRHHTASRDTPVAAHRRRNAPIASH